MKYNSVIRDTGYEKIPLERDIREYDLSPIQSESWCEDTRSIRRIDKYGSSSGHGYEERIRTYVHAEV